MLVEVDSGHTATRGTRLVDVPAVIDGNVGGKGREHTHRLDIER
jgi:hypothetical protein